MKYYKILFIMLPGVIYTKCFAGNPFFQTRNAKHVNQQHVCRQDTKSIYIYIYIVYTVSHGKLFVHISLGLCARVVCGVVRRGWVQGLGARVVRLWVCFHEVFVNPLISL